MTDTRRASRKPAKRSVTIGKTGADGSAGFQPAEGLAAIEEQAWTPAVPDKPAERLATLGKAGLETCGPK